ncbi:MAG: hypothetical protein ACRESE_03630 [Gammaproteobacteria bacterium]
MRVTKTLNAAEQLLQIADSGAVLMLGYAGAMAAHSGESWFGVAVGFRMLQAAGSALSSHKLWDRDDLFVVSGHPGQGVRDAIEYVTCCVSRGRYRVESENAGQGCRRGMRFAWEVGDGVSVASVQLRDDFVPEEFYGLLDRRGTPAEGPHGARRLAELKQRLAVQLWDEPPARLFNVELRKTRAVCHA